jgi:hypothetical protein
VNECESDVREGVAEIDRQGRNGCDVADWVWRTGGEPITSFLPKKPFIRWIRYVCNNQMNLATYLFTPIHSISRRIGGEVGIGVGVGVGLNDIDLRQIYSISARLGFWLPASGPPVNMASSTHRWYTHFTRPSTRTSLPSFPTYLPCRIQHLNMTDFNMT